MRRCAQCHRPYNDQGTELRELPIWWRLTAINRQLCATCARRPDPRVRSVATEAVRRRLSWGRTWRRRP